MQQPKLSKHIPSVRQDSRVLGKCHAHWLCGVDLQPHGHSGRGAVCGCWCLWLLKAVYGNVAQNLGPQHCFNPLQ